MCPILTTAYGLSISAISDDITITPLSLIFENFKGLEETKPIIVDDRQDFGYLNHEYGVLSLPSITRRTERHSSVDISQRTKFINKLEELNKRIRDIIPKTEQEIDMFFAWYYENNISIGDTMINFVSCKIEDEELRNLFESTAIEWNKELKKREENKKKDLEAARKLANTNFRKIHEEQEVPRPKLRKRFLRPKDFDMEDVPDKSICPFVIGDKIQSVNLSGIGTITAIYPDNCTISFIMDDGLSYTEIWKDCYKESNNSIDSYFPSQRVILQKTAELKKQLAVEEQKRRENIKMEEGLAALMDKYNKKK